MANYKAQEINDKIEVLEQKCSSLSYRLNDPANYKKDYAKLERLRKQFIKACNG